MVNVKEELRCTIVIQLMEAAAREGYLTKAELDAVKELAQKKYLFQTVPQ